MLFFYKNYKNCIPATFVSLLGGMCLAFAIVGTIGFFAGGLKDKSALIGVPILVALYFGFRKLADFIAKRKEEKQKRREEQ